MSKISRNSSKPHLLDLACRQAIIIILSREAISNEQTLRDSYIIIVIYGIYYIY